MTQTNAETDYAVVFEELLALNAIFKDHSGPVLPNLNPLRFEIVDDSDGIGAFVVVKGLKSGTFFMCERINYFSSVDRKYGKFAPAKEYTYSTTTWRYL